ncbi:hypothetical protein C8Q70DRAFT_963359 [Cubamyces menziesii]|nr:hypothetical protein C8Q70DRAFT_963359 [Cubamyces menziesii]
MHSFLYHVHTIRLDMSGHLNTSQSLLQLAPRIESKLVSSRLPKQIKPPNHPRRRQY